MVKSYGLGYPVPPTDPVEEIKREIRGQEDWVKGSWKKKGSRRVSAEIK